MRHYPQRESAAHYFGELELAYERDCYDAAIRAGLTQDEAEACDDGNANCDECPFRKFDRRDNVVD